MASPNSRPKGLLTLEESLRVPAAESSQLFARHVNPGLHAAYRWLGTDALPIASAAGCSLHLSDGRTILDFSSGFGVAVLGHGHPRVAAAEDRFRASGLPDVMKVGPHPLQGPLAAAIAACLPAPLEVSFFATSGAEAVEAAMKLAQRARPGASGRFVTTRGAYHGKTAGALGLTTAGEFREGFLLGLPRANVIEVDYGDLAGLERVLLDERARGGATAVVVESLQGQAIVDAPTGYLAGVAALCRTHGTVSIFDEVKVGLLRTGTFAAFEPSGAVPDIVTFGKGLGGGRHAMSVAVTSRELFERAYGGRKGCALHTTTFGGLGTACAVAIETLNVLADPEFVESVRARSRFLDERLRGLQAAHPDRVRSLRGRGLFRGVELAFDRGLISRHARSGERGLFHGTRALYTASIVRTLLQEHGLLAHFCESDPTVLHLMPPLVVGDAEIARFVDGLDATLSRGTLRTIAWFAMSNARQRLS